MSKFDEFAKLHVAGEPLVLFNIWFKAHMRNCPGCHDRYQGEWLGSGPEYAAQLSLDGRSA